MIRTAPAALLMLAAAAGCDGGSPAGNVTRIEVANPHHDRLAALSPPMQRLGLMRAIRDSGKRCQRVDSAAYQQDYRGMKMWVAQCNDGRHWAIFIAPNADLQVRDCAEADQLDLPQCRPIAPTAGQPAGS